MTSGEGAGSGMFTRVIWIMSGGGDEGAGAAALGVVSMAMGWYDGFITEVVINWGCCSVNSESGIIVISSADSMASVLSNVIEGVGGGGEYSGGGQGFPYSSLTSRCITRQWSAKRVRSWKASPQCLHLWMRSRRCAWMWARK